MNAALAVREAKKNEEMFQCGFNKGKNMTQRVKFGFVTLLAVTAASFAPMARADEWNKETVLTFTEPVEIPGQVLSAGTYIFKLYDSQSDRNVVQIFTQGNQHLVATVMAIPDYRTEPTGDTLVTLEERPMGSPRALHTWFYPGDNYGVEFVYPKSLIQYGKAEQPESAPASTAPPEAIEQDDNGPETPVVTQEPEKEVIIAQAIPPAPAGSSPSTEGENVPILANTLPKTAGNFVMVPLLGIVLLSGGVTALQFATKRM
jgi:hypothetical protein